MRARLLVLLRRLPRAHARRQNGAPPAQIPRNSPPRNSPQFWAIASDGPHNSSTLSALRRYGCVAISPLWLGGLAQQQQLCVVHDVPDLEGATAVCDGMWLGGWRAAQPKGAEAAELEAERAALAAAAASRARRAANEASTRFVAAWRRAASMRDCASAERAGRAFALAVTSGLCVVHWYAITATLAPR